MTGTIFISIIISTLVASSIAFLIAWYLKRKSDMEEFKSQLRLFHRMRRFKMPEGLKEK